MKNFKVIFKFKEKNPLFSNIANDWAIKQMIHHYINGLDLPVLN
ncbi:4659_t:CDS:2 [Funneliformis geosporum]|nr:4659_t:CDS:2 [Funneliformis geosporum]